MAEEIKKVISVDLGNTSTSLKEYRKHIDDLKGALLQLDSASEDYAKVAKEIQTEQNKLNEVMKVGKTTTDAVEGSYNHLTQTMAELKKEWKATADEARRAELGEQILSINNKLKELDASTGNFQRNVGDYSNAFEKAFDKCLDGITSLDGPLGELGGNVKNMLPIIKNINSTALAGLSGIKKGIASTGIGILIIALSELTTHWKDFAELVGVSEKDIKNFKTEAISALTNIIDYVIGFGNAFGNFLLTPIRSGIEAFKGLGNIFRDIFTGNWKKIKDDATEAFNSISAVFKKGFSFKANFEIGKEAGLGKKIFDNLTETGKEATKTITKSANKEAESPNIIKSISDAWSGMFKKALDLAINEIKEEAKRRKDWLETALQDAINEANQAKFELSISGIDDAEIIAERTYEIERELIEKKIALQKTYIEAFIGTEEEKEKEIRKLAALEQELSNKEVKYNFDNEQKKKKDKEIALRSSLDTAANVFGTLSELMEEGSEEQKAFAIMETTISTLTGAIDAYKSMASIPYVGPALGAIAAAAVTAAGVANIAKIKSTTKESSSSGGSTSIPTPQIETPSMTEVSPLLDETADINRLEQSNVTGDSENKEQNIRCYVVESDITTMQNRVNVVESNATF